jgi:hypothetical protein
MRWSPLVTIFACLSCSGGPSAGPGAESPETQKPDHETQVFAVNLMLITLMCLASNKPVSNGRVVVAAQFTKPGVAPRVFEAGSTPGNERAVACAVQAGEAQLKTPSSPPSLFAQIFVPVPGGPKDVRMAFPESIPRSP